MITVFWIITVGLVGLALCFVLPWTHRIGVQLSLSVCICLVGYSVYYYVGDSQYINYFYSAQTQSILKNHVNLRVLLGDLRKKEFNFHLRLEDNPNDKEAQWNLFNIMGIEAYERQQYAQAIQYWEEALSLIPKETIHLKLRSMIEGLVANAKMKE